MGLLPILSYTIALDVRKVNYYIAHVVPRDLYRAVSRCVI